MSRGTILAVALALAAGAPMAEAAEIAGPNLIEMKAGRLPS